jgi:chromosome segregation ATPase
VHFSLKFKDAHANAEIVGKSRDESRARVVALEASLEHARKVIKDEQDAGLAALRNLSSRQQNSESKATAAAAAALQDSQAENASLKTKLASLEKTSAASAEELHLQVGILRAELVSDKARVEALRVANAEIKNDLTSVLESAASQKAQIAEARANSKAAAFAESVSRSRIVSIEADLKSARAEAAREADASRASTRVLELELRAMKNSLQSKGPSPTLKLRPQPRIKSWRN